MQVDAPEPYSSKAPMRRRAISMMNLKRPILLSIPGMTKLAGSQDARRETGMKSLPPSMARVPSRKKESAMARIRCTSPA